tara:strand:+ start:307 stop:531 length:225 start_codon:yes stop_codon:yes gene_type:complete
MGIEPGISRKSSAGMLAWATGLGISNLNILDPRVYLLDGDNVMITNQGLLLYQDDDDLSNFGAEYVKDLFRSVF